MILIGTMNLTRTRDRGDFYCPTCAANQTYRLRARRPFLTLYFIPTVPVGGPELFVHCDHCKSTWDPSVLEMDEDVHQHVMEEQFRDEAVRAAVLVVIADGQISDQEIMALQRIASRMLNREVDREELGRLCSIAAQNQIEASNYVLTVSHRWSKEQREQALQAMFMASTADEGLGTAQMKILSEMRDILELTDLEFEQAIEAALSWEAV
jgi:uncharacterized tellurite resistance protein B-like protein